MKRFCCICLATDATLYTFVNSECQRFIAKFLTERGYGKMLCETLNLICYQCKPLLEKAYKFVKKALIAQDILHKMYKESKEIKLEQLKTIDRNKHGLSLNLSIQHLIINFGCFTGADNEIPIINSEGNEIPKINDEGNATPTLYDVENDINVIKKIKNEHDSNEKLEEDECELNYDLYDAADPLEYKVNDISDAKKIYNSGQTPNATLEVDFQYENVVNLEILNIEQNTPVIKTDDSTSDDNGVKSIKLHNTQTKLKTYNHKQKRRRTEKRKKSEQPIKKKYVHKKEPYKPSAFDLSMASFAEKKRQRNKNKYVYSNDSDISSSSKNMEKEKDDCEFKPELSSESSDSDDSIDLYDDLGRIMKKPDPRTFPMKCEQCDAEISGKSHHYRHYVIAHPQTEYPYRNPRKLKLLCQFCGYETYRKDRHDAHELTHSSEAAFACHKCPKRFKNSIRLHKHLHSTHTNKFLECNYCGKNFKTRIDIIRHLRIHTGEKPFKCHICSAGFAHKGNIGIHIRTKHQGQPTTSNKKKKCNNNYKKRICSTIEEEDEDEPLINTKKKLSDLKQKATKNKKKLKKLKAKEISSSTEKEI